MKRFTVMLNSVIVCLSLMNSPVMASEHQKSIAKSDENVSQIFEQNSNLPIQVAGLGDSEMMEKIGLIPVLLVLGIKFGGGYDW